MSEIFGGDGVGEKKCLLCLLFVHIDNVSTAITHKQDKNVGDILEKVEREDFE